MEVDVFKKTVEKILGLLGVEYTLEVVEDSELNTVRLMVSTKEPNILIGKDGKTLFALSHIAKRVADKQQPQDKKLPSIILDINNYQDKMIQELKEEAHMLAERARYYKNSVEMKPLPSYERMIIHSLFSKSSDIDTVSKGDGLERRIVFVYNK